MRIISKITRCTITSERKHVFASNDKFPIESTRKQVTDKKWHIAYSKKQTVSNRL